MSQWSRANLWRLVTRPEYIVEVEELRSDTGEQMIFVHVSFFQFSPSALKQLHKEFEVFRNITDVPLYCTSPLADAKWERFIKRFGFELLIDNGENRLFIARKKEPTNGRSRHV